MKTPPYPHIQHGRGLAAGSIIVLLLSLPVFLLFRPYLGVVHDARLYVGYAMAALDPDGIGRDIVFLNDGQSNFSLYPLLLRKLAVSIGPSRAAAGLTYASLMVWLVALVELVRRLLGLTSATRPWLGTVVLAVTLSSVYGGQAVFHFAENFATPRVLAEACVLIAFCAALGRNTLLAGSALVVGMIFHPLMAAPGIGITIWMLAQSDGQRRKLVVGALVAILLTVIGTILLGELPGPWRRFDSDWLRAINTRNAIVFLHTWTPGDASRVALHAVTIAMALPLLRNESRQLAIGALVVAAAGVCLSAVGADITKNILITQVQSWRALWVTALVAVVLLGVLIQKAWSSVNEAEAESNARLFRQMATVLLVVGWQMVEINSTAIVFALLASILWWLPRILPELKISKQGPQIVGVFALLIILSVTAAQTWVTAVTYGGSPDGSMRLACATVLASGLPNLVALAAAWWLLQARETPISLTWSHVALSALSMLLLVSGVLDSRSAYQRFVESELDARAIHQPVGAFFAARQPILWPYSDIEPWALAGSAGWGTLVQGMPSVFDRQLSISWAARTKKLATVGLVATAQTGALTIGSLELVVDSSTVAFLCAPPERPAVIAMPTQMLSRSIPSSIYVPAVPKLLFPEKLGAKWGKIDSYSLVACRSVSPNSIASH